jgi:hypothetical protein
MVTTIDIIQLIFQILIAIALLYMAFFKSYFQEKGKNLATKEDIEEITKKVESIKTGLQFSLEAKLSWRAEEHDALVDYYSKYGALLSGITNISFAGISDENIDQLSDIRSQIKELEKDYSQAKNRMELFVENKDILKQSGELRLETLTFQNHAGRTTFELAKFYLEHKGIKSQAPSDEHLDLYREMNDKSLEIYQKFTNEQKEIYESLYPKLAEHRSTISAHLKQLVTEIQ